MTPAGERPAHTLLLAAGIPIVEHLTGLENLPPTGARFTAAPPRIAAFGTFPVRAYAAAPHAWAAAVSHARLVVGDHHGGASAAVSASGGNLHP